MKNPPFALSPQPQKPVVLITGCGSGLGLALAKKLYHNNFYRTVVTARSEDDIRFLKRELPEKDSFIIRKLDITNEKERERLVASIYANWRAIDILINNAGISYRSVVEHMDDESELHQLNVNYLAPMALIRLVIPGMREKGAGRIVNISSVSGMVAMPTMASYSASKHALEGATEALWYELFPFGIKISLVQPGFIRSLSFEKVHFSRKAILSGSLDGPYADFYTYMGPFIAKLMKLARRTPDEIAEKILRVCQQPKPSLWIPATPDAIFFSWLKWLLPRHFFHKLLIRLLPKRKAWGGKYRKTGKNSHGFRTAL